MSAFNVIIIIIIIIIIVLFVIFIIVIVLQLLLVLLLCYFILFLTLKLFVQDHNFLYIYICLLSFPFCIFQTECSSFMFLSIYSIHIWSPISTVCIIQNLEHVNK